MPVCGGDGQFTEIQVQPNMAGDGPDVLPAMAHWAGLLVLLRGFEKGAN